VRILHKPINEKLPSLYKEIGDKYDDKVLNTIASEVFKSVLA
jgi:prohibitin 1